MNRYQVVIRINGKETSRSEPLDKEAATVEAMNLWTLDSSQFRSRTVKVEKCENVSR